MSASKPPNPRTPPKPPQPEKFQPKVLIIWLAIVAAILGLFFFAPGSGGQVITLKIPEVMEAAAAGEIREGVIKSEPSGGKDWSVITGKIRN
ncbi:MAG: cell division protein FtsH, partial [Puniceicoccaceae bacterium]